MRPTLIANRQVTLQGWGYCSDGKVTKELVIFTKKCYKFCHFNKFSKFFSNFVAEIGLASFTGVDCLLWLTTDSNTNSIFFVFLQNFLHSQSLSVLLGWILETKKSRRFGSKRQHREGAGASLVCQV